MDKVLVNRAYTTLNVVCVALLTSAVFEVLLTGLRNYVFAHTTNRIDVELGARLFRHLVTLPLAYFEARHVGDTVARVRELENIRNFLTGQALTAVIDLIFSLIFLGAMCLYSVWLTLIVAISLPAYAAISMLLNPILRDRLNQKFVRGAPTRTARTARWSGYFSRPKEHRRRLAGRCCAASARRPCDPSRGHIRGNCGSNARCRSARRFGDRPRRLLRPVLSDHRP